MLVTMLLIMDDSASIKLELCGAETEVRLVFDSAAGIDVIAGAISTAPQTVEFGYVRPESPFR